MAEALGVGTGSGCAERGVDHGPSRYCSAGFQTPGADFHSRFVGPGGAGTAGGDSQAESPDSASADISRGVEPDGHPSE